MNAIRRSFLVMSLSVISLVVLAIVPASNVAFASVVSSEGLRIMSQASATGCQVSISGTLNAGPNRMSDGVRIRVGQDCRVTVEKKTTAIQSAGGRLAALAATSTRGCLGQNWTDDAVGEWKALLQDDIHFDWDGSNVVSYFNYGTQAAAQNGLYVHSGPVSWRDNWTFPQSSHNVTTQGHVQARGV